MPTRDEYVAIIKSAALTASKKAVVPLLLKELPAGLTTGVIGAIFNPVLGFIVGKVLELAIEKTELGLFFLYTDLRTSAEGRKFYAAAKAHYYGKPAEKVLLEKDLIAAFKPLAKFI